MELKEPSDGRDKKEVAELVISMAEKWETAGKTETEAVGQTPRKNKKTKSEL